MEDHAKRTNSSMVDLFGSVDAGNASLNLTGLNAKKFAEKLEDMKNKSGELNTAYEIATANIKSEWDKLCNAMDSKWRNLVTWLEKPIYITLKTVRKAVDGDNSAFEDYNKNKAEVARLEAEQQKLLKVANVNPAAAAGIERIGQDIARLNKQIKIVEDKMAADRARQKEIEEEKARKAEEEAAQKAKEAAIKAVEDKAKAIEAKEKQHKDNLNKVEINYLTQRRDYMQQQQNLLNMGIISKDEYDRNVKLKDQELLQQQRASNAALYREMEEFYRKLGELDKANEFKKKVIEVELQITQNTTLNAENREDLFLQAEAEKRKEYQAELLANEWEFLTQLAEMRENGSLTETQIEWEFLTQLAEMRENGSLTETQIEEFKEQRMKELELARLEREAEELQNRLTFYNSSEDYKQQAVDTLQKIEENALKREKIQDKQRIGLTEMTSNLINDIQKKSKDTLLQTYEMLAKGQIKSLDDFKKFAAMQLAEVMIMNGQEALIRGGADVVKGISFAANPATAALAPPEFASAAKNFAFAAAMGLGASALYSASSEEEKTSDKTTNNFDKNIDDRIESANKESEGIVYVDVSNSALTKLLIKDIEKELKDGYNVTLVGKKKR